jgi:ribosomal protein S18 acetylase RimI-like enzyme
VSTTETDRPTVAVRDGNRDDLPQLAAMLARSYQSCPGWEWYLPPESRDRMERIERFFHYLLDRFYLRDGRDCFTTEGRDGASLWDPPNRWKLGARENVGLLSAMVPVFRGGLIRAVRGFGALDSNHPSEPHYYLSVLGVEPGTSNRGVAKALLQTGLERCDREQMPAYAETARPRSRDFYGRHGFEVIEEFNLPGGGPPVWRLWREPGD